MEKINITTEDGITLSALFWNQEAFVSVFLIHMMPETKESWMPLANELAAKGFNVLAIDLRGHGESDGGDYQQFSAEQHYGYFKDQAAAIGYLKERFPHTELYLGGASIGANMTIKYMAEHPEVAKGFALSPGLDYYGVRAIDDIQNMTEEQHVLLVGSHDDTDQAGHDRGAMVEQLHEVALGVKEKIVYDTGGHGTDIWKKHPELIEKIVTFITT